MALYKLYYLLTYLLSVKLSIELMFSCGLICMQGTATEQDIEFFVRHITADRKKVFYILFFILKYVNYLSICQCYGAAG